MDIRNRVADVERLRTKVLQGFLKLILCDSWQEKLYNKVKDIVEAKKTYWQMYKDAFSVMRNVGYLNYTVDLMDDSFINQVVLYCPTIIHTIDKTTNRYFKDLIKDRNTTKHSNESEPPEELYRRCLIDLDTMLRFVNTVDQMETTVDESRRLQFVQEFSSKIKSLVEQIDDERISSIQIYKEMDRDIQEIIQSPNQLVAWNKKVEQYRKRFWSADDSPDRFFGFIVRASDAGIAFAHHEAALFFLHKKQYEEMERRLWMSIDVREKNLSISDANSILGTINDYLYYGNEITPGMMRLIDEINERFPVTETPNGLFRCKKKK